MVVVFSPAYLYGILDPCKEGAVQARLALEAHKFAIDYAKKIKQKYQQFDKNLLKVDGEVIEVEKINDLLQRILCRIFTFRKAWSDSVNRITILSKNGNHKFAYCRDFLGKKGDLVELDMYPMSRINEFEEFKQKVLEFIEVNPFPELVDRDIEDTMKLGIPGEDDITKIIQELHKTELQNLEGIITNYRIIRPM